MATTSGWTSASRQRAPFRSENVSQGMVRVWTASTFRPMAAAMRSASRMACCSVHRDLLPAGPHARRSPRSPLHARGIH